MFDEVQARTQELAQSVQELQALGEVSHAVNSTLDLETVLSTIVAKAVQLSSTDAGAIYVFSNLRQRFRLRATYGMSEELIEEIGRRSIGPGESYIGSATQQRQRSSGSRSRGGAAHADAGPRAERGIPGSARGAAPEAGPRRRRACRPPPRSRPVPSIDDRSPADIRGAIGARHSKRAAL